MTQTRDLIKKMADFFTGEEFYEKGEDARLELSPDDVRCMNGIIKACGNAISRQAVIDGLASIAKANAKSDAQKSLMGRTMFFVDHLSSVNPQPKMGCEGCTYEKTGNNSIYPCSHCGRCYTDKYKAESEDKNG